MPFTPWKCRLYRHDDEKGKIKKADIDGKTLEGDFNTKFWAEGI
jgi:hypothetical protein